MKAIHIIYLVFIVSLLSACSNNLSYFTQDLYDEFNWTENELKQIQFYVSEDIHLERFLSSENSSIEEGQIKIKSGDKVEKVIIEEGTPGLVLFSPKSDRFAVSFDDNPDNYLIFGPNPKAKGKYVLLAKKWRKRGGIITYGDKEYTTTSESAYAALMVDISKAKKLSYSKTTASGRTIKG